MPLQGTFDVLDFSETLRLIARQQLTGRLHVRNRSYAANLFIEEGHLVGADQSEHQTAAATGDVRGRLEEICFEMLDADRGSFEFQPGKPSKLPGTTRHKVDSVLARARKRLDEWHELQEAIPSLDAQPRLVIDIGKSEVTVDQERWRMLAAIDGRRNLRAIGRVLNLSDFDVCRLVKALMDDGVVELDGRAAMALSSREAMPTVPAPETSVTDAVTVTARVARPPGRARSTGSPAGDGGEEGLGKAELAVEAAPRAGATPKEAISKEGASPEEAATFVAPEETPATGSAMGTAGVVEEAGVVGEARVVGEGERGLETDPAAPSGSAIAGAGPTEESASGRSHEPGGAPGHAAETTAVRSGETAVAEGSEQPGGDRAPTGAQATGNDKRAKGLRRMVRIGSRSSTPGRPAASHG